MSLPFRASEASSSRDSRLVIYLSLDGLFPWSPLMELRARSFLVAALLRCRLVVVKLLFPEPIALSQLAQLFRQVP